MRKAPEERAAGAAEMSRTRLDFLWQTTPPWIYADVGESEREGWIPSYFYSTEGLDVCVRRLRGWKMANTSDVMNEIGAALQFFDGFGENWYALEECLCYLDEWLPADAYVLVVERAEEMLPEDGPALEALLTTFNAAGDFWSRPVDAPGRFERPSRPFHVLLNVSPGQAGALRRIRAAAVAVGVPLRGRETDGA